MVGEIFGALIALLGVVLVVFAWLIGLVEVPAKQWAVRVPGLACMVVGGYLFCTSMWPDATSLIAGAVWRGLGESAALPHDVRP
jgi:hypothetical protein